jgi:glycosyltransferase involved in cell wall biosynthesis
MSETVSCIVPVYNGARFLAEALNSILAQTLPPAQIIVVDDGSTDGTAEVAAAFASRIEYVKQPNAGPGSARNRGIGMAGGSFLSFLDADDLWHPEKLERQLRALDSNPAAGISLTYVQNFWTEELAHERERLKDHAFSKPTLGYVCQCLLARRSVFDLVGRFDETKRIGEDTDWFLRARFAGVANENLTDVLVQRRIHGGNISFEMHNSQAARADLLDNVLKHLRGKKANAVNI